MTKCVIKVCRNYKNRKKTTQKVTYHRIPIDPEIKNTWVNIIKASRKEIYWKPAKSSVICSDHFHEKDFVHKKRTILLKSAVPSKALFLSSAESEKSNWNGDTLASIDSENESYIFHEPEIILSSVQTDETNCNGDIATNVDYKIEDNNLQEPESSVTLSKKGIQPSTSGLVKVDNLNDRDKIGNKSSEGKDIEDSTARVQIGALEQNGDIIEDFSDLESVFDTPQAAEIRRELRRRSEIQKKHTYRIQSLRQQNLRLRKKVSSLMRIIRTLKKERHRK